MLQIFFFYNIGDVLCVCINLFKIYMNIKLKLEFHEYTSHFFSVSILLSVILWLPILLSFL